MDVHHVERIVDVKGHRAGARQENAAEDQQERMCYDA
jgi:hypothetical protein